MQKIFLISTALLIASPGFLFIGDKLLKTLAQNENAAISFPAFMWGVIFLITGFGSQVVALGIFACQFFMALKG